MMCQLEQRALWVVARYRKHLLPFLLLASLAQALYV